MRIAMIGSRGVPVVYSGIETALAQLCPRLVARGHEVTVYCRSRYRLPPTWQGVDLVNLPSINTKHLDTITHVILAAAHAMARPFDITHFHAVGPGLLSTLTRLRGSRAAVTIQGLDQRRQKWGRAARTSLQLAEMASIHGAHAVSVVSQDLQQYYAQRYGREVWHIPNGINLPAEVPAPDSILELGLKPNGYMLFLSRIVPEKRLEDLLEAYRALSPDLPLVVAGAPAKTERYAERLRAGAPAGVQFVGEVRGQLLQELLAHCYLFVLPSEIEGLSLALLEAMSYARCVVVSDIAANREPVGPAGAVFHVRDVADLSRTLDELTANPDLAAAYGEAAQRRVAERFTWDSIVDQYEHMYAALLR